MDDVEVVGDCENGDQAIRSILDKKPDLVLLDVQMPDCSGLDVVCEVGPSRMPMVIFVTAYDEYAVKAFEMNAVDYLLKPFDGERLRKSIERARERLAVRNHAALGKQVGAILLSQRSNWPERLVVRDGDRYEFVPTDSIDWIESANNYVQLHCGRRTHLLSETLGGLEEKLNPQKFVRIHRRRIVNVSRVVAAHHLFGGTYELELRDGGRLSTGRQYRSAVQNLIGR